MRNVAAKRRLRDRLQENQEEVEVAIPDPVPVVEPSKDDEKSSEEGSPPSRVNETARATPRKPLKSGKNRKR